MLNNRSFVGTLIALAALSLLSPARSYALSTLKQVQVGSGRIDLLFDGKVGPDQIRTEFFNDIIQLSLTDAAVYPAKISSINGQSVLKLFAYQYAPKLVRCRFTVRGKAEDYRESIEVTSRGKVVTVTIDSAGLQAARAGRSVASATPVSRDQITMSSASPQEGARGQAAQASEEAPSAVQSGEEKALLERVLSGSAPAKGESAEKREKQKEKSSGSSAGLGLKGAQLPSAMGVFGKLAAILGLIGLIAFGIKRLKAAPVSGKAGVLGALTRFAQGGLKRNGRMIEVVSSHHLGPKKSIAVVRVAGRVLVLGVSAESINLITQLSGDFSNEQVDSELEALAGSGSVGAAGASYQEPDLGIAPSPARPGNSGFSELLMSESRKPVAPSATPKAAPASTAPSAPVRSQIRNRLEGFKTL